MPLFKRSDSPELDRLSRSEERKRDALNQAVAEAAGASTLVADEDGEFPSTLQDENERLLKRKTAEEPTEFLWPYLLGWQYLRQAALDPRAGNFQAALSAMSFHAIASRTFLFRKQEISC